MERRPFENRIFSANKAGETAENKLIYYYKTFADFPPNTVIQRIFTIYKTSTYTNRKDMPFTDTLPKLCGWRIFSVALKVRAAPPLYVSENGMAFFQCTVRCKTNCRICWCRIVFRRCISSLNTVQYISK
jgi:hypothetical protein